MYNCLNFYRYVLLKFKLNATHPHFKLSLCTPSNLIENNNKQLHSEIQNSCDT